jgi:hypothetical protein
MQIVQYRKNGRPCDVCGNTWHVFLYMENPSLNYSIASCLSCLEKGLELVKAKLLEKAFGSNLKPVEKKVSEQNPSSTQGEGA